MPTLNQQKKRIPGQTLIRTFPVAKYLAVLFISLNLHRLPLVIRLFPGHDGPRALLMLWVALMLLLSWLADGKAEHARQRDIEEQKSKPVHPVLNLASFLALAVPGLLILDAASIVHLYYCWTQTPGTSALTPAPVPTALMAAGCVFWIYGRALPNLPYRSIWGIQTKVTSKSPDAWRTSHKKIAPAVLAIGALCLCIGTFI